jgi:uncharacterized 2Fe-2S/4Fe-4S cluster protein (DUF4445 family)
MTGELESVYNKQEKLRVLRKQVKDLEKELECEMAGVLSKGIKEQDEYALEEKERKSNTIDPKLFKKVYPHLFEKVVSITKKDAEEALQNEYAIKRVDALIELLYETTIKPTYGVIKKEYKRSPKKTMPEDN